MLFWRSLNVGLIGVFGGAGLSHFEFDDGDEARFDSDLYSAGIFAQYYADDTITLSIAGGIDWDLRSDKTFPNDIIEKTESWFVGASARHCVAPNFALALEGGYSESDFDEGAPLTETISVGVGVEYLFDGSGLSVFGGAAADFFNLGFEGDSGTRFWIDGEVITAFAGLRYDYGPPPGNLVERDLTGPATLSLLP